MSIVVPLDNTACIHFNGRMDEKKARLTYLDNIRSLVIILVIVMHAAVTYSGFGGWYYIEGSPDKLPVWEMVFFGLLQSFIQAWSMGILFFISAFLAVKALKKRGTFGFIKERLFRLGLPLFIFVFLINPLIGYILDDYDHAIGLAQNYLYYLVSFSWIESTGPLWFVQALLIFCLFYSILNKIFPEIIKIRAISTKNIISAILLIAVTAFIIRIFIPIGYSFYNLQIPYFASYIAMFIAGIIIGENELLENISNEKMTKWLWISLIIGLPLWAFTMVVGGALEGESYFNGGFHWQNLAFALWESLTAIGFSIGLLALLQKKANNKSRFSELMRDNAFGIYFFHAPILVIISLALRHWLIDSFLKFLIVAISASIACLIFSYIIRKIKPIGIILK